MRQKKLLLRLALGLGTQLGWVVWFALLSIPVSGVFLFSTATSNLFTRNFEKGDFSDWKKELCCSHSAEIVSSPTRVGKSAVKFMLKKSDPNVSGSKRAELRLASVPANSEYWYGFSVFVPKEYTKDPSFEIITQWHNIPDFDLGEDWRRPALSLRIKNDRFGLENHWDSQPVTVIWKEAGSQKWDLGAIAKGRWTDWVFHVKWSYKSDGLIEIWRNNQLVKKKIGPNTYNDKKGPFLKIGIYKPQWKADPKASITTERVIYHDAVQMGNASASYKDVVPRTCSTSPISFGDTE